MVEYITKLVKGLSLVSFFTSNERQCLDLLYKELDGYCDRIYYDNMGNLVAQKRGSDSSKKLMLTTHVDSPCLVSCFIRDDGMVCTEKLGAVDTISMLYKKAIFSNGTKGIFVKGGDDGEILVDIGASSKEEAAERVVLGDTVCVEGELISLGSTQKLYGLGVGQKLCVSAIVTAMKQIKTTECDIYAVFTVQGSLNRRGLEASLAEIMPNEVISLEAMQSVKSLSAIANEKGGAYSRELTQKLVGSAGDINIAVVDTIGECGLIQRSGAVCAKLAIPTKNSGTCAETANTDDAKRAADLLMAYLGA